ncbi:MAG: DUF3465 domain-containing protein [Phycisphaeraceae bacterium]|nr:DUF3465 domain-containing protein [Phycisphaeraceae bacterium]
MPSRVPKSASSFGFKLLAVLIAAAITIAMRRGWIPTSQTPTASQPGAPSSPAPVRVDSNAISTVRELFYAKRGNAWVETAGRVEKLLPDDTDTSDNSDKHQRFLLLVPGDITVLVAHNISTSQRVPVRPGDMISLRGEYEYTDKGGTIHFTHKPKYNSRNVQGGWIEFKGVRYE